MSRLADLQHRPGLSPGCFLTLYQGQIQAQHTLASTERKHGCRVPVEPRYTLLTGLIWTPAYRPRSLDRTQQHREKSHPNLSCSPTPSLQDQPFPPGLSVWEGTATKCSAAPGKAAHSSCPWQQSQQDVCCRSPGWHQSHSSDPFPPPFMWFMRLVSCSGYTKPRCAAPLTLASHLYPSLIPVQRAATLFHMDFPTLFCHEGCIRIKNKLLYFAVNPKHHKASRQGLTDSGLHSPLSCVTNPFKISRKVLSRLE